MKRKPSGSKERNLQLWHTLNPDPGRVKEPRFLAGVFLDPRDLLQVRYEMVRRVELEGKGVQETAHLFGISRPAFYLAQRRWKDGGLVGLLPEKRGPHQGHKLTDHLVQAIRDQVQKDPRLTPTQLSEWLQGIHGVSVHPRSVRRALVRGKKPAPPQNSLATRRRA